MMNFNKPQGLEKNDNQTEKPKIKEGVDFVFEQNPELAKIGTTEQYSEYLDTIFPDSKVKNVLYHYTSFKDKIHEEGFKTISELNSYTGAGDIDAVFATKSPVSYWGGEKSTLDKIPLIINSINPMDLSHLKKDAEEEDLSEKDLKIFKEYREILDSGCNKAWENNKHPSKIEISVFVKNEFLNRGYDSILHPELYEVAVFNSNQTQILGSKQDLENFKKFVTQNAI